MRARWHGILSRDGVFRATSTHQQHRSMFISCSPHVSRSTITFGCLNVRSLLKKFDDVTELCLDRHIDLLSVTETWHDADSTVQSVLGRLRSAGYNG